MSPASSAGAALVTGAGRGIGRATAERLARDGLRVVVADRDEESAARVSEGITSGGGCAEALCLDVTDRDAVRGAVQDVVTRHGRLAVVVNNAMWIRYKPFLDFTEDDIDGMLAVGLKAVFWTMQAAIAAMSEQGGGVIVNVSSPAAWRGMPGTAVYSAVKGAVTSLTRQASRELGPLGIRVNAVVPGAIPTEGARQIVDEAGYDLRRQMTPLARLGSPEEIAAGIAWLASEDASYVTGHLLAVDGGILAS
ncbi:SDR family NAD(P)-dependent oxidoreductase [Microbispora sp. CA-135349]|uniref:SDR family NAD(P)-dependent oxidoreductase n=1 Tax=Microbispora sp. CA-135349 TaxID=3239953 RepID=UPI003D90FA71